MKSTEIRQKFFDFFVQNGHNKVPSSPLIPAEDPTLLFANAGMNQFKDIFLGKEKRAYKRAVTIQKCIRAGGKHNDLDNVGRTSRHQTFFEMLGNFSFGDYFKKEAIHLAWDFLTKQLQLPADRLWVSVYEADEEAFNIWHDEIGIPTERIIRLGRKDNFWQMGDTGPCGPCSEIYFDKGIKSEQDKTYKPGDECERFLEIWNLVFMQFDRQADGRELPLTSKGIDTGMGLERITAVLQGVPSNFDTDLFEGLIEALERFSGKKYADGAENIKTAFRVLADHIRSTCLAIADGGMPSNEGRGYVLRKIIRRAALFAQDLGNSMIFAQLAPVFIDEMGDIYPELKTSRELIMSVIKSELEKFEHNLTQGRLILEKYLGEAATTKQITGEQAFKLYDTYGFPLELTSIVAFKRGYEIDENGFEEAMKQQKKISGKKADEGEKLLINPQLSTEFVGYKELSITSTITALLLDNVEVPFVERGTECFVITKQTPFYPESGGQVGDTGTFTTTHGTSALVKEVRKVNNATLLLIDAPEKLVVGDKAVLTINKEDRTSTARNHTATHLLQAALQRVLGAHIKQAGSLVAPDYLRFDFNHHTQPTAEQIEAVERMVNEKIMENIPVSIRTTTYKEAIAHNVTAFFGEKYNPESVRVVEVPSFSAELCGGTHVAETGEIGCFKITSVTALSAGTRRITATTGLAALDLFDESYDTVKVLSQRFKVQPETLIGAIDKLQEQLKESERIQQNLRQKIVTLSLPQWLEQTENIAGMPFGFITVEQLAPKELRELTHTLIQKKPGFYMVLSTNETVTFFAQRAAAFEKQFDLKSCAQWLAEKGIKSGASADSLQGGATSLPGDLKGQLKQWLEKNVKA